MSYCLPMNEGYVPFNLYREMCEIYHALYMPMGCFRSAGGYLYHIEIVHDSVYWTCLREL